MATFNHNKSALKIKNGEGKSATTKTYSGIKPDAEDGKIFEVAAKLGQLQEDPVSAVRRVDEYEIEE